MLNLTTRDVTMVAVGALGVLLAQRLKWRHESPAGLTGWNSYEVRTSRPMARQNSAPLPTESAFDTPEARTALERALDRANEVESMLR